MDKSKFYMFTTFILSFVLLGILVYHLKPAAEIKADMPSGYISWELQVNGDPYWEVPMNINQNKYMADVNGDSLIDVIEMKKSDNHVYINPGTGFYDPNNLSYLLGQKYGASLDALSLYFPNSNNAAGIRVMDINNDGLPDIIQKYTPSGVVYEGVYINTGNGWEEDTRYFIPSVLGTEIDGLGHVEYDVRFVDLNGDDLLDIINLPNRGAVYLASPQTL